MEATETYQAAYNFNDHIKGDTWNGAQFTIIVNGAPLDITGAVIRATFKHTTCKRKYELSTTNSAITIVDGGGGVFQFNKSVIDWVAGQYDYDIEFRLADDTVRTYIIGSFLIVEDITE